MRRFRFTVLAICMLLLYLAWGDMQITLRNGAPETVSARDVYLDGYPREWLELKGGYLDLQRAISTSGTVELDALVLPLMPDRRYDGEIRILVETRDEELLHHFAQYHFRSPTQEQKRRYLEEHLDAFHPQRDIIGLVATGSASQRNRGKILDIAASAGLDIHPEVIYVSEGNTPPRYRGWFYLIVGVLGIARVLTTWNARPEAQRSA
ncbi:hypothetical protein LGV61_11335 [Desulfurispirillum indicum]|uniref:Uncharacterized protein n=1 Tax=Desulfurispirillum indicum (strain ATCC BAA-1389 / DSM 22839 / S5) TaxID=653733 RepID=E6W420_DESIS|nr:hypothetical protein [Desulfurispirillum indicum]ADU66984.1 hypothetical protein Selin_2264 [Desulfurispirillum indicum S5]UCZ56309.1 hypothetical protein LGV61_11335 [Desulfurispirillum indicum]